MVVYAEFEIRADGFRIGRAFRRLPGVEVTLERIVPTDESVIPFMWVRGADAGDVVRVTKDEQAVEQITIVSRETSGSTLYRVVWNRAFRDTVVGIAEANMTLLSGRGTADAWWFEFRAANRRPISEFQDSLRANDVPIALHRLHEVEGGQERTLGHLTDPQIEALRLAFDRGYFDEPRAVTMESLAEELGITRQAFSGRLRRGFRALLLETLDGATA